MSDGAEAGEALRLDVWLWRARLHRSRSLAATACARGVRINGRRIEKPGARVRIGDVLTVSAGGAVRVLTVTALGDRRGPAAEARLLYAETEPAAPP